MANATAAHCEMEGKQRMNSSTSRWILASALLPLLLAACGTSGPVAKPADTDALAKQGVATPSQGGAIAAKAPSSGTPAAKVVLPPAPPTALELQTGIQVTQVGLTGAGGLVDVRFKVLDAAKVKALLADPANTPMLLAGDRPPLMPPHHALRGARFGQGQTFYILYPNLRSAIRPGVEVTVAMGDVRLGPLTAQ